MTIECVGPRVYTLRELVELAGRWSGIAPAGAGAARGARHACRRSRWSCCRARTLMSRDNLDSMKVANVASGKLPGLERLGIETTPLESVAPRYLGHVSGERASRPGAPARAAAEAIAPARSPEPAAARPSMRRSHRRVAASGIAGALRWP